MSLLKFILCLDNDRLSSLLSSWFSESVKQEPVDDDFAGKKKGVKRKRIKDEPMEGPSLSTSAPT